jgi:hypothetical protein
MCEEHRQKEAILEEMPWALRHRCHGVPWTVKKVYSGDKVNSRQGTNLLQEDVELWMGLRVSSNLKERQENVLNHLQEVLNQALHLVHIVEPRYLHHRRHISSNVLGTPLSGKDCLGGVLD